MLTPRQQLQSDIHTLEVLFNNDSLKRVSREGRERMKAAESRLLTILRAEEVRMEQAETVQNPGA